MSQRADWSTPEDRLLLSCARNIASPQDTAAEIQQILDEAIDWPVFARKALDHGLASLVAHVLVRVAPNMVPDDVLDGFRASAARTLRMSRGALEILVRIIETLARNGIEAIPFKGPVLAMQAYGDLALRESNDLDLLIRESDVASAIGVLRSLGYVRKANLSVAQLNLIHRLQGREILLDEVRGNAIGINTRLTPMNMVLDMDYAGLWTRAGRIALSGRSLRALAPEDEFIALAIHGGKEMWRSMRSACDAAAFIRAHERLDWTAIVERARSQGCLRMVLLAASLARSYFNTVVPDTLGASERSRSHIDRMAARVAARWRVDESSRPYKYAMNSLDRLPLHDGVARQGRYMVRTFVLPRPYHVARIRLSRRLSFAYVPIRVADNLVALPLQRGYRWARRLRQALRNSVSGLARAAAFDESAGRARPQNSDPQDVNTWVNRAQSLQAAKRFAEAVESADRALALDPKNMAAMKTGIDSRIKSCDWRRREDDKRRITEGLREGVSLVGQLNHRAICESEAEHLVLARLRAREFQEPPLALWRGEAYRHQRIRIAYVSTDFRDHVLSGAMVGCFEHHDRTRFETIAISLGVDDRSELRRRVEAAFDKFVDVQNLSDAETAKAIRDLEIDIAIDQNGYSGAGRSGILACRPAPVQVNYLAYPGTMGATFMDYIIADETMIPDENQIYYREQVVYLPHSYLPYDRKRSVSPKIHSRVDEGLPETGFVFVCNNAAHKIGPEIFDIWMRVLAKVEGSVLWLQSLNPWAMSNLRREARTAGIDPERLVFAARAPRIEDHLARLRLADIFLDTLPYNAHATASDALWAGVPVLTCLGATFPARVAAGVLYAVGLPELVASSLAQYEALASGLAQDPERLAAIRAKLMRNRDTEPLFDTRRFTRDLEAAYTVMWERSQRGLPPKSFSVERIERSELSLKSHG
jgi:predicted O-linked N-acetylglucosamine transferase (SPINDLY family)